MTKKAQEKHVFVQYQNFENWNKEMLDSPFVQASRPEAKSVNVNGKDMKWGIWNLIVSKRDISMYTKHNMIPTRGWKVSDVKWFFGIKGSGPKLLERFMIIFNTIIDEDAKKEGEE